MRIPRFYHPDHVPLDQEFPLSADAAHHASTVLRMKANQPVVLFNGDGNEYSGQIISVSRKEVMVEIDACLSLSTESALPIHLAQGISKGDRMETVLQKSVELGVTEITPVITERCTVKLDQKRWEKKFAQWQKVIIGACEQSGRNRLPVLHPVQELSQFLSASTQQHRLVLSPVAQSGFSKTPYKTQGYRLLIGPEGGLSEQEVHQAQEGGYGAVNMGPRILRTETAAIASISLLQGIHGDI
ncbi:16S rRNA (uracil(1498)-N(3))-methyltransferase [Salinimonas sp. HHU 13199]|uniref:Ribosomal RNA small subunit methyltransferase E n=1 Tax=Salinimonas profundi TaxID=2729140 RepID=A0ABR8LM42_9ALTE|nr:16S rRNA (uracil(1498)-N(3))-methyltransferase [Salinimonas profundi]MBD3586131.1 16S rRNA (uracil(1498)-N(3))-methyltransferase [Salinimonas profundi]